jgi:ribosomal protein S30
VSKTYRANGNCGLTKAEQLRRQCPKWQAQRAKERAMSGQSDAKALCSGLPIRGYGAQFYRGGKVGGMTPKLK